ncbi:uncharacterized protein LOC135583592 isoform X1 [Musa acuminata AAA Group]|uniref:uncharacterized protein LOC135583592 isoform X1 n=1 Tax=Musa acuminata AAA Group TaxID=214697 RepID=UPI0031D83EF5
MERRSSTLTALGPTNADQHPVTNARPTWASSSANRELPTSTCGPSRADPSATASLFTNRFSEFGVDGGPAAKSLRPKYNLFMKHVSSHLGIVVPHVEMKHVIASTIFLKGFGGLLFIFSSSFGAYLLLLYLAFITPVVYAFYNYDIEKPEFVQLFSKFAQNLALFGALLFFLGMKNSIPRRQPKKVPKSKNKLN